MPWASVLNEICLVKFRFVVLLHYICRLSPLMTHASVKGSMIDVLHYKYITQGTLYTPRVCPACECVLACMRACVRARGSVTGHGHMAQLV